MKTLIVVPCMDQVPARFAQALAMLQKDGECAVAFQIGSLIYDSRNALAKKAIQMAADFVLWLDSDMVFPPDTLQRMMKTMKERGIDILTGLYYRRVPPYSPVIFDKLEIREDGIGADWTNFVDVPKELFKVGGCGFGCVLMRTDVLMSVAATNGGRMFDPYTGLGEDLALCWRARKAGYEIWCDPELSLGHVGNVVITHDYYDALKLSEEEKCSQH